MSDKQLSAEELQAKLEASARVNAELIEREKKALEELRIFKEAEAKKVAEELAAKEKAEADAKIEAEIQARVKEELSKLDSLGTITTVEETGVEEVVVAEKTEAEIAREKAIEEAAARIK